MFTPIQPVHAAVMFIVSGSAYPLQTTQAPIATSMIPSQTYTPALTSTQTPTTTLVPLPILTLIFPAPTNTSSATITPTNVPASNLSRPTESIALTKLPPRIGLLSVLLVCLWLFLIGFVIVYLRQFK